MEGKVYLRSRASSCVYHQVTFSCNGGTPDDAPAQDPAAEQGLAALQVVQALVTESFKTAMVSLSHELMEAVDRWIAAQLAPTSTPTASRASGESSIGVVNLPSSGKLPPTASLTSMLTVSKGAPFQHDGHRKGR